MTPARSIIIVLLFAAFAAKAQEVVQRSFPVTSSVKRFDTTIFIVDGYKAPNEILTLFKPNEVELNPIDDPTLGEGILVMGIHVIDTGHVVLKYLKHKASMDVGDQNFPHGKIPAHVRPGFISGMEYIETDGHKSDILIVTLSQHSDGGKQKMRFTSQPKKIQWYDVDGTLMTQSELQALNLKLGEFESGEVITGQKAVEKYGDAKYADGVKPIRRINKKEQP